MPLVRYFTVTSSLLLALLFLADWYFPKLVAPPATAGVDKTIIRLHSAHRWPEAVVFDTSLPTIVPPQAVTAQAVVPAAAPVSPLADASAQARVRETYAQLIPAEAKKPGSPVQRKRKIARSRPAQPMQFAQRPQMQVAQQSHFGFFGGSNWNSTW